MSRVTRAEWYRRVNEAWPEVVPQLEPDEAVRAARRLYRFHFKRRYTGAVVQTSGNRYSRLEYHRMRVNGDRGWKDLAHDLSHAFLPAPHGGEHARLELRLIKEIVRRGWLAGILKREPEPPPAPDEVQAKKIRRTEEGIERWRRKLARAQRALLKLHTKLKRQLSRVPPKLAATEQQLEDDDDEDLDDAAGGG